MIRVLTVLTVLLCLGVVAQSYYLAKQSDEIKRLNSVFHEASDDHEESHELVGSMGSLQLYFGKAWFAGQAENWELAHFYVHEMEETMEEIVEGKVIHDGKDISKLMKDMAWDQLETLEERSEGNDLAAFKGAYSTMVKSCNSCHAVTGHPFIVIQEPTRPAFDNQNFELQP